MTFALLSPQTLAPHTAAHYGAIPSSSADIIAEVTRCELFALGHTVRWVLAQRVAKLLAPFGVTAEAVDDVLETLEAAGDVTAGPGGEVARAPLRAVPLRAGRWLFAGTVPTAELKARVEGSMAGLPRRLTTDDDERVRRAVVELGGRELSLQRWAALDRTPPVGRWLEELAARLATAERFEDRAAARSWDDEEVFITPGRWHAAPPGDWPVLVRARQSGGWKAYAWARLVDGKAARVPLTWDEARRTMLAVNTEAGRMALYVERRGGMATIALPVALPAAEYRWLAAMGEMRREPREVEVEDEVLEEVAAVLRERLEAFLLVDGLPWL
jgi:hypothetical protein